MISKYNTYFVLSLAYTLDLVHISSSIKIGWQRYVILVLFFKARLQKVLERLLLKLIFFVFPFFSKSQESLR